WASAAAHSARSAPAQKLRPLPVSTTTRTAGSLLQASSSACSCLRVGMSSALRCSERLSVIQATPASTLLNSDDDGVVMGGLGVVVMVLAGLDEGDTKRVFNKVGWGVTTSHNSV